MDFTFDEEHREIRLLAADLFDRAATQTVTGHDDFDRAFWHDLAASGLLGVGLPAELGGEGLDFTALCVVLEQQGRRTVPAPIWPTVVAAMAIAEFGRDEWRAELVKAVCSGDLLLTVAVEGDGSVGLDPQANLIAATASGEWTLSGRKFAVPAAGAARRAVVTAATPGGGTGLFLVDLSDPTLTAHPVVTTDNESGATIDFEATPATPLGDPDGEAADWIGNRAQLAVSALQLGVADGALAQAVPYLNGRNQFGRPLASFQAVAHQLADCYIDVEAMRVTLWHAVWATARGLPVPAATAVAKWWASDAGQRVVHRITHLHGGMGVDTDYPIHRYLLWGKQLAATLGGASSELARIGDQLAGMAASSS